MAAPPRFPVDVVIVLGLVGLLFTGGALAMGRRKKATR
jgi:LPXTG-motif cell wall-anchored protein